MRKRILSITGNRPLNYLLKTTFSKDYSVITANDISSGISLLKSTKDIGLFIIDADYQRNESIDFIKFISNSGMYARPAIVLLTDKEIANAFDKKSCPYFFYKPFNPQVLVTEAKKLMERTLTAV